MYQGDRGSVKQIKGVPTFDGTKAKFPAWKRNFLYLAKLHDIFEIFTEGVDVPVADEGMSVSAIQRAFPGGDIQKNFVA